MFDVTAIGDESILIERFDISVFPGTHNVRVYYKEGSYVGSESTPTDWTLHETVTVTSAGFTNRTPLVLARPIGIPAGRIYGIYMFTDTDSFVYTRGANTFQDANIRIDLGTGNRPNFGPVFNPRTWNGTIYYSFAPDIINPNQDVQIRNGDSTDADSITSNGLVPLSYGTYKRNETVVLDYLVRNPGALTLELGELNLPPFMSVVGDALPERLGSFEGALLSVAVDTSAAGTLEGQVSLTSDDPDANENPFVFDVIITVSDDPANALYVLSGIDLPDVTVTEGQQNVPVYSFKLSVPASSAPVTINALNLNTSDLSALRDLTALQLYIDGGTRGELDRNDVPLATLTDLPTNGDGIISFTIPERTLLPDVPMWFLVVGDF
ncbi:MAG: hypothetical protein AAF267_06685 [Deinococcota bacterium]